MVSAFQPVDPEFEARVRDSFARQPFMATLGARLSRVEAGVVEIDLPFSPGLSQQHGFFHGGVVGAIADSAAGYAAYSLMPSSASVLTVEYKINLIRPSVGEGLRACGIVVKPGRQLTICNADVVAYDGGGEKTVATALFTMMVMEGRSDGHGLKAI